jgi:uncharacterized membrane protein SirB2
VTVLENGNGDVDITVDGAEPLDARLGGLSGARARAPRRWAARMRLALGLPPTPRPGLILIPLGMALGPHALGVLSDPVLATVDPAVSVALAALGAFVGMDLEIRRPRGGFLLFFAASVEGGLTLLAVAGGVLALDALSPSTQTAPWLLALLLGICAAPSSTADAPRGDHLKRTRRIGDLDDVLPIVVGVLALAAIRQGSPVAVAWLTLQTFLLALTIAAAGWLLVSRTSSVTEERVFAIGALLLLGGAAAYLSLSALFTGFVAGLLWHAAGAESRERITRDLGYLQHPLIALLLIVAGARVALSMELAGLVGVYLTCRIAGKLIGGLFASVIAGSDVPRDIGLSLMSPGIVGIAFALNVVQAHGDLGGTTALFAVVIAGSLVSDLLSLFAPSREQHA